MGLFNKILPKVNDKYIQENMPKSDSSVLEEPPIKLYNHIEITNEYKEYKKGKKSYEIQDFHMWLLETYPNMLFIKRDN